MHCSFVVILLCGILFLSVGMKYLLLRIVNYNIKKNLTATGSLVPRKGSRIFIEQHEFKIYLYCDISIIMNNTTVTSLVIFATKLRKLSSYLISRI